MAKAKTTQKRKSATRKSNKKQQRSKIEAAGVQETAQEYVGKAKQYVGGISNYQKAAYVAGAVGILALLASKAGRSLLKTAGGIAMPIVAGIAQKKVTEQVSNSLQ